VLDLLETLHAKGLTLLVITHDPEVAQRAKRVLMLADGKIVRRVSGEPHLQTSRSTS
jgi:putative ABC transport system ATP-binding protein